jgi:beta-glucanase (GH16 family)
MNHLIKILSVLFVLSVPFLCPAQDTPPPGYHLLWEDDFSKDPDGLPDPAKWNFQVGFLRNHEEQFYTKARLENCRIEHGQLIIEGRKETYSPSWSHPDKPIVAKYTAAAIDTTGKFSWQYGRLEVKAQLPAGAGVWPAIWGCGIDGKQVGWPKCGEIDTMELVGKEPNVIHGTMHYFANGGHQKQGGTITIPDTSTAFHVYAAEWTPDRIDLFVDDKKYFSFDTAQAVNDGQNPFQ